MLTERGDPGTRTNRFAGKGLAGFVKKPYEVERLTRAVREVLRRTARKDDEP